MRTENEIYRYHFRPGQADAGAALAQVNRKAAVELKKRFLEEFRSLESLPQRYLFFNTDFIPPNKYHKLYVQNWFLVLYQIKDDTVYIDWIVDCRQDYPWLLK